MEEPQPSAPRRVEAYLDTVLASLPRRLSAFQLDELRRELRTHLWERVAAYEEMGQTEDAAVTEALTQFGGGKDFVKQWRREWKKPTKRITAREVWEAIRLSFLPTLIGLSAASLPVAALAWYSRVLYGSSSSALMAVVWTIYFSAALLLPVLVGARRGARLPERAGVGITGALLLECLAASLLSKIGGWVAPASFVTEFFNLFMGLTLVWIPVAGGAAALTGWLTRWARARRVA